MHLKESKGKYIWGDLEEGRRRERYCNYIIISNKKKRPWIWVRGHRKDLREKRKGCLLRPVAVDIPGSGQHLRRSLAWAWSRKGLGLGTPPHLPSWLLLHLCFSEGHCLGPTLGKLVAEAWFRGGHWLGPASTEFAPLSLLQWRSLSWTYSSGGHRLEHALAKGASSGLLLRRSLAWACSFSGSSLIPAPVEVADLDLFWQRLMAQPWSCGGSLPHP